MDASTLFILIGLIALLVWLARRRWAQQQATQTPEFIKKNGRVVLRETCSAKTVQIYDTGLVQIAGAFSAFPPPEKLLSITNSADVTKKSALGRGIVGVATLGVNFLSPNKRGDLYLTIVTDKKTHMLHSSPPTEMDLKAAHKIAATGNAVLERLRAEAQNAQTDEQSNPGQPAPPIQNPNVADVASQIEKLAQLHKQGILSDEQFEQAKSRVLGE